MGYFNARCTHDNNNIFCDHCIFQRLCSLWQSSWGYYTPIAPCTPVIYSLSGVFVACSGGAIWAVLQISPAINSCPSGPWVEREQAQHRLMMQSPCRLSPGWLEPGHLGNNGASTVNRYTPEPMPGEQAPGRSCPLPPASAAPWSTIAQEGPTKSQNHPRDQQTTFHRAILNERGKNQQHLKKTPSSPFPRELSILYIIIYYIYSII